MGRKAGNSGKALVVDCRLSGREKALLLSGTKLIPNIVTDIAAERTLSLQHVESICYLTS
jgi:hypothetical protein